MRLHDYLNKIYSKEEQKKLKYLNCSSQNITSLDGIENLTNLGPLFEKRLEK